MLQIISNLKRYKFALIAALVAWIAIIVASGAGFNPTGVDWNFSNTGTFGDSFGPISALMASLAALAAFSALHEQKQESTNAERREAKREKQDAIRTFENTFFNLVGFFEKTVAQTDIDRGTSKNMKYGRDAFSYIYNSIDNEVTLYSKNHRDTYNEYYNRYINDLAHYFRLFYNIIVFIDMNNIENKYFYTKIFRSLLSDSEIGLIALNCVFHEEGRKNLKPLIEKYGILNNLSKHIVKTFKLEKKFEASAFKSPSTELT
jgi:hypothetical protein